MKKNFPLKKAYTLLGTGPVVLLTTAGKKPDVMTLAWHTMIDFYPPLVGCVIGRDNFTAKALRKNRECVINIPTRPIAAKVMGCGSVSGAKADKFAGFGLTPEKADKVAAPLLKECYASLECVLHDASMAGKYDLYILKVVKAWADPAVKNPATLHHRGGDVFMTAGPTIKVKAAR